LKTSICLASFNGGEFIKQQIESILPQLEEFDELIVRDDCSSDDTVDIIKSFQDPRIRLYVSEKNIGCVKNFEMAIAMATGDIIFLADQDDIWEHDKILQLKNIFAKDSSLTGINHAVSLMNINGKIYKSCWKKLREGRKNTFLFLIKQLIKGQIQGCSLAFRADLKPYILPFPKNVVAHDSWIGIVSAVAGKIYFHNKPLVRYRRHSNSFTAVYRLDYLNKIKVRLIDLNHIFIMMQKIYVNYRENR
jgi:glycosyltransferase involved in cell wall biosynthesis